MKNNIQFYAVEWAPNGTNELLVVAGNDHTVIDSIPNALFGFKRTGFWNSTLKSCMAVTDVGLIRLRGSDEYDPGHMAMVGRIARKDLRRYLAVSPFDPAGAAVLEQLKRYGVK